LFFGGVREEVAAELFDGELVEGFVFVEGADDVVAVGPDGAGGIVGVAGGVSIAGEVEPHAGPVWSTYFS
jgi:hypothetical protein